MSEIHKMFTMMIYLVDTFGLRTYLPLESGPHQLWDLERSQRCYCLLVATTGAHPRGPSQGQVTGHFEVQLPESGCWLL